MKNYGAITDPKDITTKEYVDGKAPVKKSISLSATWSGSGPYTQTVTISGYTITPNSKVDLQFDASQIEQMISDGVSEIYADNNNGALTVFAVGASPTVAITVQCIITEVSS